MDLCQEFLRFFCITFFFLIIAGMVKELYMPDLTKAGMEHFGSLEILSGMINDKRRFVIIKYKT